MKKKTLIICVLIIFQLAFIWGNSVLSRDDSGSMSSGISEFVKGIVDPENKIDAVDFHHVIRKLAHFSEFFVLGTLFMLFIREKYPRGLQTAVFIPLFCCLLAAVTDEFIQSFTGRGSSVRDVFVDFLGALCAITAFLYLGYASKKHK